MFPCVETEASVVVVVRVRGGDVDDVDIGIGNEFSVRTIGICRGGRADGFEKVGGAR